MNGQMKLPRRSESTTEPLRLRLTLLTTQNRDRTKTSAHAGLRNMVLVLFESQYKAPPAAGALLLSTDNIYTGEDYNTRAKPVQRLVLRQ